MKKHCNACNKDYPLTIEYWSKFTRSKDGFTSECRECKKARDREYARAHRKEAKERHDKWREENRKYVNEKSLDWYHSNKEKHFRATKNWKKSNPDKMHEMMLNHNRRVRQRKYQAEGNFTEKEFQELCQKYNNTCLCCGRNDIPMVTDHVIPLVKGGSKSCNAIHESVDFNNISSTGKSCDYQSILK